MEPVQIEACWKRVGTSGDRSCPNLRDVIHCRNCPVYSDAGRILLDRIPPTDYLQHWTRLISTQKAEEKRGELSVLLFRLGEEYLALSTEVLQEIAEVGVIHSIPHRTNDRLLGMVNIRGSLILCFSLATILGIEKEREPHTRQEGYPRWVVIAKDEKRWMFPADEVFDVAHFRKEEARDVPVTAMKSLHHHSQGILVWKDKNVGLLNEDSLIESMERSLP